MLRSNPDLDDLTPEEIDAIASAIVDAEEHEQAIVAARGVAFAAGRRAGLAERPRSRPGAETRRHHHDRRMREEVAKVADDPNAHPVRRLRLAARPPLSQAELARLASLTPRAIWRIEKGHPALPRTRSRLAAIFDVASRDLGVPVRGS